MDDTAPAPQQNEMLRRIAELEVALAAMTRQREETRRALFDLYAAAFPDHPPPTEAELLEERKTLVPGTISDFLAELDAIGPREGKS